MPAYIIQTKGLQVLEIAKDRDYAFATFFKDVQDGRIPLSELGNIIILIDPKLKGDKGQYPFRTVPLLFSMKLLSQDDAVSNIMATISVTQKEAEDILFKDSFKDSRLIPLIEELSREEHK